MGLEGMHKLESLVDALEHAREQGYTRTFSAVQGQVVCSDTGQSYSPNDLTIVHHQRFEGPSSEDDNAVLYLVQCNDGAQGAIVDAYGTYADGDLAQFLRATPLDEGH